MFNDVETEAERQLAEYEAARETRLIEVIEEINHWNYEDIRYFKTLVAEFFDLTHGKGNHSIDFSDSKWGKFIPKDIEPYADDYPIWACDKKGYCLVGDGMSSLDTVSSIRAVYGFITDYSYNGNKGYGSNL